MSKREIIAIITKLFFLALVVIFVAIVADGFQQKADQEHKLHNKQYKPAGCAFKLIDDD